MIVLLTSPGQPVRKYRREATRRVRAIVSDVYSAARVTASAIRHKGLGIESGLALDLTTTDEDGKPWDFSDAFQRKQAETMIDEQVPTLLIGTPMCAAFSLIQHISKARRNPEDIVQEILAMKGVLRVVGDQCQYGQQTDQGHPLKAPTGFISNAPELLNHLSNRCFGKHGIRSRTTGGKHSALERKRGERQYSRNHRG